MAKLDEVQYHYEKFPYPPSSLLTPFIQRLRKEELYLLNYTTGYGACYGIPANCKEPKILVVGCGTLEPLAVAKANPHASILAIDISERSLNFLSYNLRLSGLKNRVRLKKVDICTFSEEKDFDYIIATGVIHHLENPLAGLKQLETLAASDGVIRLMLYSKWGRHLLYRTKEMAQLLGVKTVKEFREMIARLPASHPYRVYFHLYSDAESDSGLMDGYLHPCDQAVDTFGLRDLLESAGISLRHLLHRNSGQPSGSRNGKDLDFWNELCLLESANQMEENFSFFASPARAASKEIWHGAWRWNPALPSRKKIYSKILDRTIELNLKKAPIFDSELVKALIILPSRE